MPRHHARRRIAAASMLVALGVVGSAIGTGATASATVAPQATATAFRGSIDRSSRAAVLAAYRTRYVAATRVANAWTGSVLGCLAGTDSAAYTAATLQAINWARAQAGIPPVPGTVAAYTASAQQAALMMQAQGALAHQTTTSWRCWTPTGAAGASHSNLALGVAGARAVGMYLVDPGSANLAAGHRRWLLFPRLGAIGIGNTASANAVYVLGRELPRDPAGTPAYYGWPSAGYFPRAAEPHGLWSLSSSRGWSFARAGVRVVGPGGRAVRVVRYAPQSGFGDSTLVWRLATVPSPSVRVDQSYRVTVTGIRTSTGATTSYSYVVTLVS